MRRVKKLTDPAHRFKVRKNAEQFGLTGIVIFNPGFSFVYVEGPQRFVRKYKQLMLARIGWTEAARPRGAEDVELAEGDDDDKEGSGPSTPAAPSKVEEAPEGEEVSLEENRCDLVWEGQLRERSFGGFKPKSCPTDSSAKEALGTKLAGYWDAAKHYKPAEEEMF